MSVSAEVFEWSVRCHHFVCFQQHVFSDAVPHLSAVCCCDDARIGSSTWNAIVAWDLVSLQICGSAFLRSDWISFIVPFIAFLISHSHPAARANFQLKPSRVKQQTSHSHARGWVRTSHQVSSLRSLSRRRALSLLMETSPIHSQEFGRPLETVDSSTHSRTFMSSRSFISLA